jgi:uracil-DNA glycosylase
MIREELSKYLFRYINTVEPSPELVVSVPKMMDATAFFPGGTGLWKEEQSNKFPSILVLGQDFSTVHLYDKMMRAEKRDIDGPTWRNLRKLFQEAELDLTECFFSNVFMGLRNTESMTGRFPGAKDNTYVKRSTAFLMLQIKIICPRIIITLGKYPSEILSILSDDLNSWKSGMALRSPEKGILENVFIEGHRCTCIALVHPSMRNSNVHRRKYKDFSGNGAEVAMLRDALNQ